MALVVETPDGPDLVGVSAGSSSLNGPKITVQDRAAGGPVWLEEARRAGVSAAAIALGESGSRWRKR